VNYSVNSCSDVRMVTKFRHIYGLGLDWGKKPDKLPIFENPPGRPDRGPKRGRVRVNPDVW